MQSKGFQVKPEEKVAVSMDHYYTEIDRKNSDLPWGAKCLLINRTAGVMYEGVLRRDDTFPTHFAPVPRFRPEPGEVVVKKEEKKLFVCYLVGFYHQTSFETEALKKLEVCFKCKDNVRIPNHGFFAVKIRSENKDSLAEKALIVKKHFANYGVKVSDPNETLNVNYPVIVDISFAGM